MPDRRAKRPWTAVAPLVAATAAPLVLAAVTAEAGDLEGPGNPSYDALGLTLSPAENRPATFFDWSADPESTGGDTIFTLDHFTPRLSGLALTLPDPSGGTRRPGLRAGTSASGAGLDFRPGSLRGQDILVTIGTGFSSEKAPALRSGDAMTFDTAGMGARVRIARVSLGSAVFGTKAIRFGAGPGLAGNSGGFDFDLSYSFDAGSLSLQHFIGLGQERVGQGPGQTHDRDVVAVSGRYLLGPSVDMTAWVGHGGAGEPQAVQSDFDGWAMLTGLRLSF